MERSRFEGKTALVTGAATGIGRAAALAFSREGANVVAVDISEAAEQTVADIRAAGGSALFLRTDVSDAAAVQAMVAGAVETYGRLDCAYNNAGIFTETSFTAECEDELWDRIVAVNLRGVFLCVKHEVPALRAAGGGAIVNCSSATAYRTVPGSAAYSATKAGVSALTRVAAVEYGADNIRINAIAPAGIDTPMLARGLADDEERRARVAKTRVLKRLASAEEAAESVLWLCSDEASYITAHTLFVDGGAISAP